MSMKNRPGAMNSSECRSNVCDFTIMDVRRKRIFNNKSDVSAEFVHYTTLVCIYKYFQVLFTTILYLVCQKNQIFYLISIVLNLHWSPVDTTNIAKKSLIAHTFSSPCRMCYLRQNMSSTGLQMCRKIDVQCSISSMFSIYLLHFKQKNWSITLTHYQTIHLISSA